LACVVYEIVGGRAAVHRAHRAGVLARHSLDMVSPPSIVRVTIPDAVEDAILRALAKTPADRFPTTALFAEALPKTVTGDGAMRRVTRATPAPRRWLGMPPAVVAAFGVVVLAVTALVTGRSGQVGGRSHAPAGAEGELDARMSRCCTSTT